MGVIQGFNHETVSLPGVLAKYQTFMTICITEYSKLKNLVHYNDGL